MPAKLNVRQKLLLAAERHYLDFELPAAVTRPLRKLDNAVYGRSARSMPIDRPIFIVGCHRSGTTILYEVIARHPDLVFFTNASSLLPDLPIVTNRMLDFVGERGSALERFCQDELTITYRTPSEGILSGNATSTSRLTTASTRATKTLQWRRTCGRRSRSTWRTSAASASSTRIRTTRCACAI
jgi:hypothetical protein